MTQIKVDRESDLGKAIFAHKFGDGVRYLVLKGSDGKVMWSGILDHYVSTYDDAAISAEFKPVEQHIKEQLKHQEDILRFSAEKLGIL